MVHLKQYAKFSGVSNHVLLNRYLDSKDEHAFETLIARHTRIINSIIPSYLSSEDREDLFIEVVSRIAKNLEKLNLVDFKFSGWVNVITTNCLISFLRTVAYRNSSVTTKIDNAIIYKSRSVPTDAEAHYNELEKCTREIIEGFGNRDKSIVQLFLFDRLKYREIAETLAIPVGTVKGSLFRAMIVLREKLVEKYSACGVLF